MSLEATGPPAAETRVAGARGWPQLSVTGASERLCAAAYGGKGHNHRFEEPRPPSSWDSNLRDKVKLKVYV